MGRASRSRAVRALGLGSALAILTLAAGSVVAGSSEGIECADTNNVITVTSEPRASDISATTPRAAVDEMMRERGPGTSALEMLTGKPLSEVASRLTAANEQSTDAARREFEYQASNGNTIAELAVEAVGDGRYFVTSMRYCEPQPGP